MSKDKEQLAQEAEEELESLFFDDSHPQSIKSDQIVKVQREEEKQIQDQKPFKCDECDKEFDERWKLTRHKKQKKDLTKSKVVWRSNDGRFY